VEVKGSRSSMQESSSSTRISMRVKLQKKIPSGTGREIGWTIGEGTD
jgi:hypothetical protein